MQITHGIINGEKKWMVGDAYFSDKLSKHLVRVNHQLAGYDRLLKERNKLDVQLVAANENIERLLKELRKRGK